VDSKSPQNEATGVKAKARGARPRRGERDRERREVARANEGAGKEREQVGERARRGVRNGH
jgi:hypothetical protein